jgi:UDP-glucose 4-epimerase
MRVLVTGSNGFIGWHTCKRLVEQGIDVIGVDDLSEGAADNAVAGVRYHTLSVADAGGMVRLMREAQPAAVIHLAARPRVRFTVEQPLQSSTANLLGTISVLDSLLHADLIGKTRLVFASSSAVYGVTDVLPTPETHPCDPQSPYALQKHQCEEWCRMFHRLYGLDVVSLRYFNVFGPGAAFGGAYSLVLSAWLYHLYVEPSYRPYLEGDGTQTRDFCYVEDVAWANVTAATLKGCFTGKALNIAQGRAYSLLDTRIMLEEVAGRQLDLERRPPRTGDVQHTLADITRAREELGYQPSTDFRAQLEAMASWFRNSHPR